MSVRLKFKCWNQDCGREYSLLREVQGQPKLLVQCPFCDAEAEVDLAPCRSPVTPVYKGIDPPAEPLAETLLLPDVLPTTPREE